MNPQEKRELAQSIRHIRDSFGVAILLIEHDMGLRHGHLRADHGSRPGPDHQRRPPAAVQNCPRVIQAYLGVE